MTLPFSVGGSAVLFPCRSFYDKLKDQYEQSSVTKGFEQNPAENLGIDFKRHNAGHRSSVKQGTNSGAASSAQGGEENGDTAGMGHDGKFSPDMNPLDEDINVLKDLDERSLQSLQDQTRVMGEKIGNAFLPVVFCIALFLFGYWFADVLLDGNRFVARRNRLPWQAFADYADPRDEIGHVPVDGVLRRQASPRPY